MFNFKRPRHKLNIINENDLRLSDLKPGEIGRIIEIGGSENFRYRLMEMGITRDVEICVDKYAPLRDPMELIVKGYHLSLRGMDAQKIAVKRIA
ncbi:MAG: ferrous iron transport protein A [Candidatus Marinimicrobia bacterium]|nr:ferrous iron transport protein A [Candidatus Neomarinimicrobiota bacterium]MCF7921232.1 ferrous iron transport protein A [Candidatus Neomarinimicrobiota bacterium]